MQAALARGRVRHPGHPRQHDARARRAYGRSPARGDWLEYSFQNYNHLVEQPMVFEGGYAIAPERPGHGLALAETARTELGETTGRVGSE